jgi:hypothetical protein
MSLSWLDTIKARAVEAGQEEAKPVVPARRTAGPYRSPRGADMSAPESAPKGEIKTVSVTTRVPTDSGDPGSREIGHYYVVGDTVMLCSEDGAPITSRPLSAGDDARVVAARLTREAWMKRGSDNDFNRPLNYNIKVV